MRPSAVARAVNFSVAITTPTKSCLAPILAASRWLHKPRSALLLVRRSPSLLALHHGAQGVVPRHGRVAKRLGALHSSSSSLPGLLLRHRLLPGGADLHHIPRRPRNPRWCSAQRCYLPQRLIWIEHILALREFGIDRLAEGECPLNGSDRAGPLCQRQHRDELDLERCTSDRKSVV